MDIAALSMGLSQFKVAQEVGIGVLKLAQDQAVQQNQSLLQAMQTSVQPHLGQSLDLKV